MIDDGDYMDLFQIPDYTEYNLVVRSTNKKWYQRLWILISNPFCYLFKGYVRF